MTARGIRDSCSPAPAGFRPGSRPCVPGGVSWLLALFLCLLAACGSAREDAGPDGTGGLGIDLPPTWTPTPDGSEITAAVIARLASPTLRPTKTPLPTLTPSSTPTATPRPIPTTAVPPTGDQGQEVPVGVNLLPNPSFEEGWYNQRGAPELQVASSWFLEWDEGFNHLDPSPTNPFYRPEARVLPKAQLPEREHDLFIWDGDHTVKIFKKQAAISFRLLAGVYLVPASYRFEVNVFPDLYFGIDEGGGKIWADNPLCGELQFMVGVQTSEWILPEIARKNTLTFPFDIVEPGHYLVGAAMRGRWGIENNGWFMDDWSLVRLPEE